MHTQKTLKQVNLPPFIETAQDAKMQQEIDLMDMLIKVYRSEMVRIVLDVLILFSACLILAAVSR